MRLLTLSDIHFKETYASKNFESSDDVVSRYLKSFKEKIDKIHAEKEIDVVVVGGDIAFSGDSRQYKGISRILRKCIPEGIPIFSIVGNHEVNWTELSAAIGTSIELPQLFKIEQKTIVKSPKFHKVFANYYDSFQTDINEDIDFGNLKYEFCDKNYSGYVYSEQSNVLILLLNSSWYSFGPGVVQGFFNEWAKGKDKDALVAGLPALLGDTLAQEGKQSYFFDTYPYFSEVNKLISENNDLKVITFAHHPPSWLKWEELYSSDSTRRNFITLTDLSQILITGHLHNPVMEPSIIRGKCYHVNNGIFLDYHSVDKHLAENGNDNNPINVFPNNWFNLIDINEDGFDLTPYKFISKKKPGKGVQFVYDWMIEESVIKTCPFLNNNDEAESSDNKTSRTKKDIGKIKSYSPRSVKELIEILKRNRSNEFENVDSSVKSFKQGEVISLKKQNENYLIVINSLEEMLGVIQEAGSDYQKLQENRIFSSLLDKLEMFKPTELPIIAFYEIVQNINGANKEEFEKYYQRKTIIYQSFKYSFFGSFKEFHKFNELNIVFDTIVK